MIHFHRNMDMVHDAINGNGICFSYELDSGEVMALNHVDICIPRGAFVAILGHNGCGKSTLVKHFDALLPLQVGALSVAGLNVRDLGNKWRLRRECGMVFQNPDNQFVSTIVEDDIAFGLENYETPLEAIPALVQDALERVGMSGFELRATHTLSGGQKQRVALAGVLALSPDILVFDEATAMLDPEGRREVLASMHALHAAGKTVVMISHYVEEAVNADEVYLIHDGEILAHGSPSEMLSNRELMRRTGLIPPLPVRIYYDLLENGIRLPVCPLTDEALVEAICQLR